MRKSQSEAQKPEYVRDLSKHCVFAMTPQSFSDLMNQTHRQPGAGEPGGTEAFLLGVPRCACHFEIHRVYTNRGLVSNYLTENRNDRTAVRAQLYPRTVNPHPGWSVITTRSLPKLFLVTIALAERGARLGRCRQGLLHVTGRAHEKHATVPCPLPRL